MAGRDHRAAPVASSPSKREFDVQVAGLALLFVGPLTIFAALAIRIESGGPILLRQRRTGLGGEGFFIYTLRTMNVLEDGREREARHSRRPPGDRVGTFLRKSSIDELNELLSVPKGDSRSSAAPLRTGPPRAPLRQLPDYPRGFRTGPGITGLIQASVLPRRDPTTRLHVQADHCRLCIWETWSLALDLKNHRGDPAPAGHRRPSFPAAQSHL